MGSIGEECNEFYVDNTVFVAVGKHLKESESILSWVVNKFGGKKKICVLHVHQPASLVSFFGGRLSVSKFQQRAIDALRDADVQKLRKLACQYIVQLSYMGVHADRMWIEMDNIEEGIVNLIAQHGIRWLVMGAAADKSYKKEMTELKSKKAIFVCEQAPAYCHIWFICRGNHVYTREGRGVDPSLVTEPLSANIGRKPVYLDVTGKSVPREEQSIHSCTEDKDSEHVGVQSADKLPIDSDVSTDESESSPLSFVTEEGGFEDEHDGVDSVVDEHNSPPRLIFRERGSILRTYSADFDSQMKHHLVLSTPRDIGSGNGLQRCKSHSSLNLASFEGKMVGKARLHAPREIYKRLEQAISDSDTVKHLASQDSVKRWTAEEDAMYDKKKANAAECKFAEEMKRNNELEKDLAKQRLERKRFKEEHAKFKSELPIIQAECSELERQVKESEIVSKELEEKIISAVDLLISFRNKKEQLQVERDNAVQEMNSLKRLKEQRVAAMSGPQFSTFSLVEIGKATCGFDQSMKIGDGTYGSIYHGILGHMEVAIRMLPNDGTQGQFMFEHQVEILSRVRHPNIVTLIGSCPEARSIIYEYLERGNLQDNLTCKGKTRPLLWQTRIRIATELCSALIFLHTNNPPIFHGNLKPTKILLDTNFVTQISDLGIFHLILQYHRKQFYGQNCVSMYTDPEFLSSGVIGPESDIFSFGMILLQLITGNPGTIKDVKRALQRDNFVSILDYSAGDWPVNQVKSLARVAVKCCERIPSRRPNLVKEVWPVLESLRKLCDVQRSFQRNQETRLAPSYFVCPISKEVMNDPYTAADGYTYEGEAIRGWLDCGHTTSPMTNLELPACDLIPNHALQFAIQEWLHMS